MLFLMVLLVGIHTTCLVVTKVFLKSLQCVCLLPKTSKMRGHVNACQQSVPLFVTKCPHACQQSVHTFYTLILTATEVTKFS